MALGNVFIKDVDGNIPYLVSSDQEKVTGLLFDTSMQPQLFEAGYGKNNENKLKLNDVIYITSRKSSITDFGIVEWVDVIDPDEENNENFFYGIPPIISVNFSVCPAMWTARGRLYVMFADCSTNWEAIDTMQSVAGGTINHSAYGRPSPCGNLTGRKRPILLIW